MAVSGVRRVGRGLRKAAKKKKVKDLKPGQDRLRTLAGPAEQKVVTSRVKTKSAPSGATLTSPGMQKQLAKDTKSAMTRTLTAREKDTGVKRTTRQLAPASQIMKPTSKIESVSKSRPSTRPDKTEGGSASKNVTGRARTILKRAGAESAARRGTRSSDRILGSSRKVGVQVPPRDKNLPAEFIPTLTKKVPKGPRPAKKIPLLTRRVKRGRR